MKLTKKELTTMKRRLTKTIMGSLVAAAMAFGMSGIARADCGVQTLRGSYLFATHGWNIVGGIAQPKAIVEGIDFNGDGTLVSPFATVSINGNIFRSSGSSGSYTVAADCRGTLTFTGGPIFDIFVDPSGRQLWMIQTGPEAAPPAVFEGTATRLSPPVPPRPASSR